MTLDEEKKNLRRRMRALRLVADQKEGPDAGRGLTVNGLPRRTELGINAGTVVAGYWPIVTEIDIRPLLARLEQEGAVCALPVVADADGPLVFRRWGLADPLEEGPRATYHPLPSAPEVTPEVVFVPLLAFDADVIEGLAHLGRDTEAVGSVLAVDDDEIKVQAVAQLAHPVDDDLATGAADHIAAVEDPHARSFTSAPSLGHPGQGVLGQQPVEPRVVGTMGHPLDLLDGIADADGGDRPARAESGQGAVVIAATLPEPIAFGVDAITTGNHVWDRREIVNYIGDDTRLLRPLNYPEGTPGIGAHVYAARDGRRVMVLQVMGRLFMGPLDDPFAAAQKALLNHRLGGAVDCIVTDIHAEASSEKAAFGHILDGRVSLVVGTHTHVPSADCRIMPGGTAYMTDVGMCGDYDSVIGMEKEGATARFTRKMPSGRLEPAEGDATLCAVFVETDDDTGLAKRVAPLRTGGHLAETWPDTL